MSSFALKPGDPTVMTNLVKGQQLKWVVALYWLVPCTALGLT